LTDGGDGVPLTSASAGPLSYDRARVQAGIVHIGVGAFCRAHLFAYVDDVLRTDPGWGIVGASLRRPDTRDALKPQDWLYTLCVRGAKGDSNRIVGSLLDVLVVTRQRDALMAAMTDPRVRIVSLTVTEKGYCHDPATGELDPTHPDIVSDLAHPKSPVSAPGILVRAIELRRAAGIAPFTVLCCDNLPANGETTARIVTGLAALRDDALARHIEGEVAFPSTMVDRIVPATTDTDRARVLEATGLRDAWPVVTEPFSEWVIEDRFSAGRPRFESVGAQLVADVRPYELRKLRMLNGSHSMLAYLGYLAGHEFVSQAIAEPALRTLVRDFMTEEAADTLPTGLGEPGAYRDLLLERFANPALGHRTWQIAMDGSQKLPQRLLGTIRERLSAARPIGRAALGVAAWMRYVGGVDEHGREIDVRDPLAARLRRLADPARHGPDEIVAGLLGVREVFGDDLPRNATFRAEVEMHLASLLRRGALETVCAATRQSR